VIWGDSLIVTPGVAIPTNQTTKECCW
jgi:hypothetical protein